MGAGRLGVFHFVRPCRGPPSSSGVVAQPPLTWQAVT
jgi:hypothetical protein